MMGERTVMQEALFYEFSLEQHVPAAIWTASTSGSSSTTRISRLTGGLPSWRGTPHRAAARS